jgi:ribose transport system substrate-binding protein
MATRKPFLLYVLVAVLLVAAACGGDGGDEASAPAGDTEEAAAALERQKLPEWVKVPDISEVQTRGNTGEEPTWYTDVALTKDQLEEIRSSGFKAAFLNWDDAAYNQAVLAGARDAFEAMGIELVAVTNYEFDVAKLQTDVQNVLPLDPDIIMYSGVDPVADNAALRPACDQGAVVVAYANAPGDWQAGDPECFATLISYDTHGMGAAVADEVAKEFPDGANIGMIYFDATYKLVNEREEGFEDRINEQDNLEIVIKEPMADPFKTESIASAMIAREKDLDVIFAPWDLPAEGVVAALRAAGREDVKVATIDLGFTGAQEIASDGLIFVESSQLVYEWGRTGAIAAALKLLGEEVPPYTIVPVYAVTKENLVEGWDLGFGGTVSLPEEALNALE